MTLGFVVIIILVAYAVFTMALLAGAAVLRIIDGWASVDSE